MGILHFLVKFFNFGSDIVVETIDSEDPSIENVAVGDSVNVLLWACQKNENFVEMGFGIDASQFLEL